MAINYVIIQGNAGQDAKITYTASGFAVGDFRLAHSRQVKGKKETSWMRIKLLGKYAETMVPLVKKGARLIVEGVLEVREYQNKAGQNVTSTEIIAGSLTLIDNNHNGSHVQVGAPPDEDDLKL